MMMMMMYVYRRDVKGTYLPGQFHLVRLVSSSSICILLVGKKKGKQAWLAPESRFFATPEAGV